MNDFRSYLNELFERPFKLKAKDYDSVSASYTYSISGEDDPERQNLVVVNFSILQSDPGNEEWEVDFTRGGSTAITGRGDAPRVFASVLDAIKRFITERKPKYLSFSAAKYEVRASDSSVSKGSRIKLYKSMISRYASKLGYALVDVADRGARGTIFVLKRNPLSWEKVEAANKNYPPPGYRWKDPNNPLRGIERD